MVADEIVGKAKERSKEARKRVNERNRLMAGKLNPHPRKRPSAKGLWKRRETDLR